jgi:glycosidase
MIHSIIMSAGGIPLIYLGDEIATLNDYSFRRDPAKAGDNRWVHRPPFDWSRAARRLESETDEGQIFQGLQRMILLRKKNSAFGAGPTLFFDTQNKHVLGYVRNRRVLVLCNFSDFPQPVRREVLELYWALPETLIDLLTGEVVTLKDALTLDTYQVIWLTAKG